MNTIVLNFVAALMIVGGMQATANIVPLQRLRGVKNGDHFYTTNVQEAMTAVGSKAYVSESVATKVSTTSASNNCPLIPVYRYYNNKNDHFYTANLSEGSGASGYVSEGIAFYCAANQNECGATEAFHRYNVGNDHFYTTSVSEGFTVVSNGGTYEGVLCFTWL